MLALAFAAFLAWYNRSGRPSRRADRALALAGLIGLAGYFHFGAFHAPGYVQKWDVAHYYLGAKYFPELGYTRLYQASVVAEADAGFAGDAAARRLRDLATNRFVAGADVLADAGAYRSRFSPARWRAFVADVATLRAWLGPARWAQSQMDHGYNGTPAWAIAAGPLANLGAATPSRLLVLALLDVALLAALWAFAAWGFGWRSAAIASVFFGLNGMGDFDWVGGGFLRMDWLLCLVAGLACLARRRPFAGGVLLAASTLLRVFPGFALGALGVGAAAELARTRRLSLETRRLWLGALAAIAAFVPVSAFNASGGRAFAWDAWPRFVENSRRYVSGPKMNFVGADTLLRWEPGEPVVSPLDEEPGGEWWKRLEAHRAARRPIGIAVAAAAFAALALLASREDHWVTAILGLAFLPFVTTLSCYYEAYLLVFAFLWAELREVGIALALLAAATASISATGVGLFQTYALDSVFVITFLVWLLARLMTRRGDVFTVRSGPKLIR